VTERKRERVGDKKRGRERERDPCKHERGFNGSVWHSPPFL
jgi:hypothetical protein